MKKSLWTLGAAALLAALPSHAGVSIDRLSPSIGGCPFGVTPATVYGLVPPGGGCDAAGAGPQIEVRRPAFGLGAGDDIDALSANTFTSPNLRYYLVFSGDRGSMGQPGTLYRNQATFNQAASDLIRTPLAGGTPAGAMAACAGVPIPPPQSLHRNQTDFNLIFTVAPGVAAPAGNQDNVDGVELSVLDIDGDQIHDANVYYSLDPLSPGLGAGSPADIFFAPAGAPGALFSGPAPLGLGAADDIDSLVIWDRGVIGAVDPGLDVVLFSLAPGSPALGAASPADIFVSTFGGAFCLFTAHTQLGMLPTDNVDGLDVIH